MFPNQAYARSQRALPFWWWNLSRWPSGSGTIFLSSTLETILINNLTCLSWFFYVQMQYPFLFLTRVRRGNKRFFSSLSFLPPFIQVWVMPATHLNSSSQHNSHQAHGHAQGLWLHRALCLVGQACTCSLQGCCYKVHHLPQKWDLESWGIRKNIATFPLHLTSPHPHPLPHNTMIARTFHNNGYYVAGMVLSVLHAQSLWGLILTQGGRFSYPHFEMKNLSLKEVICSRPYSQ